MTIKKVAELAGVSTGTVDRVIYHRGRVSDKTIQKVENIIKKYNFTPNPIARRLQRGRTYRLCALIPKREQDSGYWNQIWDGLNRASLDIAPIGVETEIIEFDRYDSASFNQSVQIIFSKEPDGVAFSPIQLREMRMFIDSLRHRNIPYVFFDADMPDTSPLCAIGQDSFKGGYLAGRLLHLFAGRVERPVAIMDVHSEDYHIIRRRDGFLQYSQEHRFETLVKEFSNNRGVELSNEKIAAFLSEYPELQGVFVTNASAHRIAEAAMEIKSRRDFFIVGYDLVTANHRLLQEGMIDAIIAQQPETQSRQALEYLFRAVSMDMRAPPRVEIPLSIFIKENAPLQFLTV
ncbi:MAG: LacI family DNA-binding transcriptional regulator [Treponema sp.]|jgi:LacI family transcriptional regulator|nr:LacI family DNA-binding transcriptional regulator [Treponema sp.]